MLPTDPEILWMALACFLAGILTGDMCAMFSHWLRDGRHKEDEE